jgi:hypothetical protein
MMQITQINNCIIYVFITTFVWTTSWIIYANENAYRQIIQGDDS